MRSGFLALLLCAYAACRVGYDPLESNTGKGGASGGETAVAFGGAPFASGGNASGMNAGQGAVGSAGSAGAVASSAGMASLGGNWGSNGGGNSVAGNPSGGSPSGGASVAGSGGCSATGSEVCDGLDNDCSGVADDGGVCPANCTGRTYDGHRYTFCATPVTWAAADADCKGQRLLLVRIDDAAELAWVKSQAYVAVGTNNSSLFWRWLGANDLAVGGEWRWPDGAQFWQGTQTGGPVGGLFADWAQGEPVSKDHCALMQNGSIAIWSTLPCTSLQPYVCELY